jgi:predicted Zn-dependent protease
MMYDSKQLSAAGALSESTHGAGVGTEAATLTISRVQRFAAEQRAIAENFLAQARDFEEQIAKERAALAECVGAAEAAAARVREASMQLSAAREAQAMCEAEVARMQARIDLPPDANGLTPDAVKRIVERRIADGIRTRAQHGKP